MMTTKSTTLMDTATLVALLVATTSTTITIAQARAIVMINTMAVTIYICHIYLKVVPSSPKKR